MTRLGSFWKVLETNYCRKVAQIFDNFWGYFKKHHLIMKQLWLLFLQVLETFVHFFFLDPVALEVISFSYNQTAASQYHTRGPYWWVGSCSVVGNNCTKQITVPRKFCTSKYFAAKCIRLDHRLDMMTPSWICRTWVGSMTSNVFDKIASAVVNVVNFFGRNFV